MENPLQTYTVDRELNLEFSRLLAFFESPYGVDFKNDVFSLFPFYWGDCTCGSETDEHTSDCALMKHNFIYYPDGFFIDWYKYPLRGAYSNVKVDARLMKKVVDHCIESLEHGK